MRLSEFERSAVYSRPLWLKKKTPLYVSKGAMGDTYYYCDKDGLLGNEITKESVAHKYKDFNLLDAEVPPTPKGKTMNTQPNSDLLTQALMPMITGIIDDSMEAVDVEGTIKAEVAKVVSNIPTKKIELIDTKGITKTVDLAHKQLDVLLKACTMGAKRPIMLTGEAGSFKTHSAELVAGLLNLTFYSMSVGEQSTKSDILGFIDANGNYRTTPFRKAFEHGGLYLLDEVDAGNPNVLLSINTAISNGFVDFPDAQVQVHKDFRLIATANTFGNGANAQYVGRNKLDLATANRFFKINWLTDWGIVEVLTNNAPWYKVFWEAKRICEDALDGVLMGSRNCMYGADALAVGIPFDEVFKSVITNGLGEDDVAMLDKARKLWVDVDAKPKKKTKTKEVEVEVVDETDAPTVETDAPTADTDDEFNF